MSSSLSKHAKHTPKHRGHRAPTAPTKVLRTSVLYSSVAVAATGVAVSGGIMSGKSAADAPVNVAADLTRMSPQTADDTLRREDEVSRSDRRTSADPAKKAALARVDRSGTTVSRTEDISDEDPRQIAQALLSEFGFGQDQFSCLDSLYNVRERVAHRRRQPELLGVRHPAGAARLQDGLGRPRLGDQPGHPDPLGPGLHPGPLRHALRRLELQAGPQLVLIHAGRLLGEQRRDDAGTGLTPVPA